MEQGAQPVQRAKSTATAGYRLMGRSRSHNSAGRAIALTLVMIVLACVPVMPQVGKKGEETPPPPRRTAPPKRSAPRPRRGRATAPRPNRSEEAQPDDTAANERAYWEKIKNSNDPGDFREYLRRYPNGQFAKLAEDRIRSLEAAAQPPRSAIKSLPRTVTNRAGIELVLIPAGSFMMGSTNGGNEKPVHQVTIAEPFYLGKYEVTQAQWQAVMGTNPSYFKGDSLPVEQVSWNDAQEFIRKLNEMNDGYVYRLPSEAEWEYACRAGTTTAFAFGDSLSSDQANFDGNYPYGGAAKGVNRGKTTPVGSFQPNGFGLYDMHGNVWEWCEDVWHENYNGAPADGSAWLSGGDSRYRVLRGGSWGTDASGLRSARRYRDDPDGRDYSHGLGIRVAAVARQ